MQQWGNIYNSNEPLHSALFRKSKVASSHWHTTLSCSRIWMLFFLANCSELVNKVLFQGLRDLWQKFSFGFRYQQLPALQKHQQEDVLEFSHHKNTNHRRIIPIGRWNKEEQTGSYEAHKKFILNIPAHQKTWQNVNHCNSMMSNWIQSWQTWEWDQSLTDSQRM